MHCTVPYALYSPICTVQSHMHHTAIPSRMQRTLPYAAYGPVLYGPVCSVQSRHTVLYPTGCVRNVDVKRRIFGAWTLIYRRECVVLMMSYICSRPLAHLQRDRAIVLHYDDAGLTGAFTPFRKKAAQHFLFSRARNFCPRTKPVHTFFTKLSKARVARRFICFGVVLAKTSVHVLGAVRDRTAQVSLWKVGPPGVSPVTGCCGWISHTPPRIASFQRQAQTPGHQDGAWAPQPGDENCFGCGACLPDHMTCSCVRA